jgi:hypothetical protein
MPGIQDTINAVLATTQSLFTVLRDVFLVALFVFLLCFPTQLNSILTKAGISQLNGGIFTWQQQAQQAAAQSTSAAQANSSAADALDSVKSALDAIASQSTNPSIRKQAADASSQAAGSIAFLENANSSLAHSVVTQEKMLQTAGPGGHASPTPAVSQGWVYIGKADPAHQHWMNPPRTKISASSPALAVGQVVTFTDNIFLRADKAPNQTYNQAAITGAVRSGSTAAITAMDYSHARKGGDFVWVKVSVQGGQ